MRSAYMIPLYGSKACKTMIVNTILNYLLCHLLKHSWTNLPVMDFVSAVTRPLAWSRL